MASKIEFFPITPIERDLIEFLLTSPWHSDAEFLRQLLARQRGTISRKQRLKLWKIPTKYQFPPTTEWPHKEIVTTISFLIEAVEETHREYWATRESDEYRSTIMAQLRRLTRQRVEWLDLALEELEDAAVDEPPPFAVDESEDIPF